jgi:hypothetical protein
MADFCYSFAMPDAEERPNDRVIRNPAGPPDTTCYLCGAELEREDKVVRVHETMMHRHCYEADIRRGR